MIADGYLICVYCNKPGGTLHKLPNDKSKRVHSECLSKAYQEYNIKQRELTKHSKYNIFKKLFNKLGIA